MTEDEREPMEVKGTLIATTATSIVCPKCEVKFELDGDFDSCLIECPECNTQLRVQIP